MGAKLYQPDIDMMHKAILDLCVNHTGVLNDKSDLIPLVIRGLDGSIDDVVYLDPEMSKDGKKIEKIILTPESYYKKYKKYYDEKDAQKNEQQRYTVTCTDSGGSNGGKSRIIGTFKTEDEAVKYAKADMFGYEMPGYGPLIRDYSKLRVYNKMRTRYCEWTIKQELHK